MLNTVLISVHSQLRRHRRKVLWALAMLAVVSIGLTARTALMSAHGHVDMSDAVAICMTVGGCVAIAGVAAFAVRRLAQRPLWRIPMPLAPASALVWVDTGFLVRAGPRQVLQVFRF